MGEIDADGAAVRGDFFSIENGQAVRGVDGDEGVKGEVAIVFLIDRVELVALDKAQEILDFDDPDAVLGQEDFQAGDKVVQIGNVGEDVVGND